MKQYLLSVHLPNEGAPEFENAAMVERDVASVIKDAKAAGAWVFGGVLHTPTSATVVRVRDGERLLTDGPFVESKEHIAGFWVIRAPDLDAALEWAEKATRAGRLPIEVRPFQNEDQE